MKSRRLLLVVHNVRSAHNVGSILRTADGLGVEKVYLTGYSPYPPEADDKRLPHIQIKTAASIEKTALGAQNSLCWLHKDEALPLLQKLKDKGFSLAALEQTQKSEDLTQFKTGDDLVLIIGNEVSGLELEVLRIADIHLQIPMLGVKESFNVSVACAVALYHLKFIA